MKAFFSNGEKKDVCNSRCSFRSFLRSDSFLCRKTSGRPASRTCSPTANLAVRQVSEKIYLYFGHFEQDLRGHTQAQGAAFSCLRLKVADMVLI